MKTRYKYFSIGIFLVFLSINSAIFAQVGIGIVSPNANSMLDVTATNKGFLPPRLTTTDRNNLGQSLLASNLPEDKGMLVFDTSLTTYYYWSGIAWVAIAASGGSYVDLTTNQTIAGMKTFTGNLTPSGRLMLPMGELSFVNYTSPYNVALNSLSTGNSTTGIGADNMEPVNAPVNFVNDMFTFDAAGAEVTTAPSNSKLKYTSGGVLPPLVGRYFHIALSFSFSPGTTGDVFVFGVSKNTKVQDSSKLFLKAGNAADYQSSAMHVLLWLDDGDEIGFSVGRIASSGTSSVNIKSFNFVAIGM